LPNILWGRVAVLGVVVLLAFLFGRMTAGGGGVSEDRFDTARSDLRDARTQVTDLQTQVKDLEDELAAAPADTGGDPGGEGEGEGEGEGAAEEDPLAGGEEYTIKAGDTLNQIAEKFYKDASLADFIADANGIDPSLLSVGDTIVIPVEPE
jgi:nucleoid-associated protein YgaU